MWKEPFFDTHANASACKRAVFLNPQLKETNL